MPGAPGCGSAVRANTTNRSAIGALVMNRFCPSMTQSSPSRRARVRSPAGFDPAPGSVSANEATTSPEAICSSHRFFCSSVPKPTSTCPAMPLLVPNIERNASDVYPNSNASSTSWVRSRPRPPHSSRDRVAEQSHLGGGCAQVVRDAVLRS